MKTCIKRKLGIIFYFSYRFTDGHVITIIVMLLIFLAMIPISKNNNSNNKLFIPYTQIKCDAIMPKQYINILHHHLQPVDVIVVTG